MALSLYVHPDYLDMELADCTVTYAGDPCVYVIGDLEALAWRRYLDRQAAIDGGRANRPIFGVLYDA